MSCSLFATGVNHFHCAKPIVNDLGRLYSTVNGSLLIKSVSRRSTSSTGKVQRNDGNDQTGNTRRRSKKVHIHKTRA